MAETDESPRLICGHCKVMCGSIEELREHMKAEHIVTSGAVATQSVPVASDASTRQTVVVYKQNADGTTTNTGQVVQLTQAQILQLLNPVGNQRTTLEQLQQETDIVQQDDTGADHIAEDGLLEPVHIETGSLSSASQLVQTPMGTPAQPLVTTQTITNKPGRKQLVVLGPENTENIRKLSLGLAKAGNTGTKLNAAAAAYQALNGGKLKSNEGIATAGVPTLVSQKFLKPPEAEAVCELKFEFVAKDHPEYLESHIQSMAIFQCQYCSYSDSNYKKASVHVKHFHINDDGTVNKQVPVPWSANNSHTSNQQSTADPTSADDLACPYCLTKFLTSDDRDFHRLKKCGPKRRYEVKRTGVRTLHKHLMCYDKECGRALYFNDHHMAIKHPRAVFGACHRNNGAAHYFSCYICAAKQTVEWKKMTNKQVEGKVSARMRDISTKVDLAAAKKDDQEADNDIDDDLTDDISFAGRGQLVEAQAMQSWDFATWKECSEHLVANHKESVLLPPKCGVCMTAIISCITMCAHLFNTEVEFIDHSVLNLKRKLSKKMLKKGNIFGSPKDSPADRMLFTDISEEIITTPGQILDSDQTPTASMNVYASRSKRFICRTCGQGFSTSTKRDKHVYTNACLRETVERNFSCSVCKKKFTTRRLQVSHETWCLYKQKRDKLMDEQRTAADGDKAGDTGDDTVGDAAAIITDVTEDGESTTVTVNSALEDSTVSSSGKPKLKRKRFSDFKCTVAGCIMGFSTDIERDVHIKCHINNSVAYKCCFCEFTGNVNVNWYPLKEHIIAKHPGHIPPEFECEICEKGFAKLSKYEEHMIKHSSVKSHTCIECGMKFKQETGLRAHVQYEHGSDEAKEFARSAQKARLTPTTAQPLLCYVCGYNTTSRSYYKTHMNIHRGVKPYRCKYCDYSSVDSTCFKRHMWRHQEKKPYKCAYCPFDGIQRSQIVAHMKSKHNVWPDEAKKLITHISGRVSNNRKGTAGSNTEDPDYVVESEAATLRAMNDQLTVQPSGVETVTHVLHGASTSAVVGEEGDMETHQVTTIDGEEVEGTATATVSIVNPDGTETQIPVELITQAAQGLAAGTNVQVAYGDYMINYMLEKPPSEDGQEEHMDTQAHMDTQSFTVEQTQ